MMQRIATAVWPRYSRQLPGMVLLGYAVFLVLSTHLPPQGLNRLKLDLPLHVSDKLVHACAYAGLTLLLWLATRSVLGGQRFARRGRLQQVVIGVGLCLLIAGCGLVDEATQPYFGRQFDWFDWLADLTGMSLALLSASLWNNLPRLQWMLAVAGR